jgi:hypothetical protein
VWPIQCVVRDGERQRGASRRAVCAPQAVQGTLPCGVGLLVEGWSVGCSGWGSSMRGVGTALRRRPSASFRSSLPLRRRHRRCLCDGPPAKEAHRPPIVVVGATRGLLMLESNLLDLPTGRIMAVGEDEQKACVLFQQHGHYFATLLERTDDEGYDALCGQGCVPTPDVLTIGLPPREEMVGRQVDCFARPLDGGAPFSQSEITVPVFANQPSGSQRGLIMDNLHTGWLAIDALTPVGRGQSMLLVGPDGAGKTTIATGAVQASRLPGTPPLHTIYGCISDDDGVRALESLGVPVISLAPRVTGAAAMLPSIERYFAAATAVAIGEAYRDGGHDSLVILDELSAFRNLWQTAAELSASYDPRLRYLSGQHEITELRPYYSALLQRSAKLAGAGSMSILTLIAAEVTRCEDEASEQPTAESGYPLSVFEEEGYAADALARLGKLSAYNVPITDEVLKKMHLPIPEVELQSASADEDPQGTHTSANAEARGAPVSPQRRHTEEMMSLSDGHILLDADEFLRSDGAEAQLPAISPTTYAHTHSRACTPVGRVWPSSPQPTYLRATAAVRRVLQIPDKDSRHPELGAARSWQQATIPDVSIC